MDSLQMELESLLVNVMQRTRNLKMETMVLDSWGNDKNDSIIVRENLAAKHLFMKLLNIYAKNRYILLKSQHFLQLLPHLVRTRLQLTKNHLSSKK